MKHEDVVPAGQTAVGRAQDDLAPCLAQLLEMIMGHDGVAAEELDDRPRLGTAGQSQPEVQSTIPQALDVDLNPLRTALRADHRPDRVQRRFGTRQLAVKGELAHRLPA